MICWVTLFQIDPAYKMEPGKDKSETDCAPYTLHDGIAISNRPLEEEDENNRVKKAEMMEKMEWLRSLEGRYVIERRSSRTLGTVEIIFSHLIWEVNTCKNGLLRSKRRIFPNPLRSKLRILRIFGRLNIQLEIASWVAKSNQRVRLVIYYFG